MAKLEHVQLKKPSEFSIVYSNRFLKPPVRYKLHREKISLSQTLNKSIDTYKRDIRHKIGLDTKPKTLLGKLLFLNGPITYGTLWFHDFHQINTSSTADNNCSYPFNSEVMKMLRSSNQNIPEKAIRKLFPSFLCKAVARHKRVKLSFALIDTCISTTVPIG